MFEGLTAVLASAAIAVGSLHSLAPDHWVPFVALARARRWPPARVAVTTALCGLGHVTASVMLGLLGLVFGLEMLQLLGRRMESLASVLLVAFGLAYALWGLHRALSRRLADVHHHGGIAHHHPHAHGLGHDHRDEVDARAGSMTAWTLFVLFSADPCIAVIPILFAAAPLGAARTAVVVGAYEAATIATMVGLVLAAGTAAARLDGRWLNRYGDVAAGSIIAAVGVAVTVFGW
jgi:nickel/cobalt transporter (NicO) family protein